MHTSVMDAGSGSQAGYVSRFCVFIDCMCMYNYVYVYAYTQTCMYMHVHTHKHGLGITSKLLVKLGCQLDTTSERLSTLA